MKMRCALPYMIIGGAIVIICLSMRNGRMKNMIDNIMYNIREKGIEELEDMM